MLKPCPFCGPQERESDQPDLEYYEGYPFCGLCQCVAKDAETWNRRPVEDALRADNDRLNKLLAYSMRLMDEMKANCISAIESSAANFRDEIGEKP